jgi:tetratricopeptide (TPR) repeat protein
MRTPERADVLYRAALIAGAIGDIPRAIALHEENFALCEELQLPSMRGSALSALGILLCRQGDFPRAIAALEEAVAISRQLERRPGLSAALGNLAGVLVDHGRDIPRAISLYEEGLAIAREKQLSVPRAMMLAGLGMALAFIGDFARAAAVLGEALDLQNELKATIMTAWTYQYMGMTAYLQADYAGAGHCFAKSLAVGGQAGGATTVPTSLEGIAGITAIVQGQPLRAARLLGAAQALRETLTMVLAPVEQPHHESVIAAVRGQLPEPELHAAWQAGRLLGMEQAIAEALDGDLAALAERARASAI